MVQNLPPRAILSSITQDSEHRGTWLPYKVQVVSLLTFAKFRDIFLAVFSECTSVS